MTNTKWTPGPWWCAQHDEFGRYDVGQGDVAILKTIPRADSGPGEAGITDYRDDQQRANAMLAARAPEFAELLEVMLYWHDRDGRVDESWWEEARSLLAKARGEG